MLQVLGADSKSKLHRLELQGLLPPWVLDRLAAVFAVTQVGGWVLRPGGDAGAGLGEEPQERNGVKRGTTRRVVEVCAQLGRAIQKA